MVTTKDAQDMLDSVHDAKRALSQPDPNIFRDAAARAAKRNAPYVPATQDPTSAANAARGGANGRRQN